MLSLMPIHDALHPTFKIFSAPFEVNCEEAPLKLWIDDIDLQFSEYLEFKFLVCHILDFYKNHMLPSGLIPKLTSHTLKSSEHVWHNIPL